MGFCLRTITVFLCAISVLCGGSAPAQSDSKRVTFYTPQTSYSLPVLDRNNTEYVGLLEALEPMGPVSARPERTKWKMTFRNIEGQFESTKTKAKVRGKNIQLAAPFLTENGHGLVPINSLKELLPLFGIAPLETHDAARRVFIGVPIVRFAARKVDSGKIAFTFSAPVNPFVATEPGKLRMVFSREPVQADTNSLTFEDRLVASASFSESNGSAELTVNGSAPLSANFSDDRKTVTVLAILPQPQQPAIQSASKATTPSAQPKTGAPAVPAAKPHPFVIIDAAHGGTDQGATLASKLVEKDVTLALAHRLRHDLELRGITCVLLRESDATFSSDQRAGIANASNAALYVALHASSIGSGVRTYSSVLVPTTRAPFAFVPVRTAQAAQVSVSRATASAMTDALLKHDVPGASLPGSIAPLDNIGIAAIAVEVGPPDTGAKDFFSAAFQQSIAASLSSAIAAAQSQFPRMVAQ